MFFWKSHSRSMSKALSGLSTRSPSPASCSALPIPCFFFNDTATTEIYTLSLHDALPISWLRLGGGEDRTWDSRAHFFGAAAERSEEHTSELQSQFHLVCRLLLEKKK